MLIDKYGRVKSENQYNDKTVIENANVIRRFKSDTDVSYKEVCTTVHRTSTGIDVRISHAVEDRNDTTADLGGTTPSEKAIDLLEENKGSLSRYGVPMYPKGTSEMGGGDQEARLGTFKRPYCVAIDAEWETLDGADKRSIITTQLAFRDGDGVLHFTMVSITQRLDLETVMGFVIEDWYTLGYMKDPSISRREMSKIDKARKHYDKLREESGAIGKKPKIPYLHIEMLGHYGLVDLTTFRNGKKLLRGSDTIRNTQVSLMYNYSCRGYVANRSRVIPMSISFRDTKLLAPAGMASLAALGKAIGFDKLKLEEGEITAMRRLYDAAYDTFYCYGMRDVHVTLLWKESVSGSNTRSPITLGAQAAQMLRDGICNANGWDVAQFDLIWRGIMRITEGSGAYKTTRKETRPEAVAVQTAAMHAYLGGRNECYMVGIHHSAPERPWQDYDLAGAYTTAMCLVHDADWTAAQGVLTGRLTQGSVHPLMITFPLIDFAFPDDTRRPCLPVKDAEGRGLIFPLRGRTFACAPEISLALQMGAVIDVIGSAPVIQPLKTRSMRTGVKKMVQARMDARLEYGKGSVQELLAKDRSNAGYGKLGQGIQGKKAYSTRSDGYSPVPESVITNPYAASMTTSLVRAMVSAAIAQLDAMGRRVASVTTDGFLSDATYDELVSLDCGGFAAMFREARNFLVDNPTIWEVKHSCESLIMIKNRGGFGIGKIGSLKLPVARASYSIGRDVYELIDAAAAAGADPKVVENETLSIKYLLRDSAHIPYEVNALPSPISYVRKDADGVSHTAKKSANWEHDQKCRADVDTAWEETIEIQGRQFTHVSYYLKPWRDIEDFKNARSVSENTHKAVKSMGDLREMDERIKYRASKASESRASRHGMDYTHARDIVRAVRQGALSYQGTGRALLDALEKLYRVNLTNNVWKKATSGKFTLDGLDGAISELGLTRIQ